MRAKTKERIERIEAAIAAGAEVDPACKAEGISSSWYYACKARKPARKAAKAVQVYPIAPELLVSRTATTEEASNISLSLSGSPVRVAEFLRRLGGM
jgi:hypothetical protein